MKRFVGCCVLIISCGLAALTQSDRELLISAFNPTNTPLQVKRAIYPIFSNVWFVLDKTNAEYGRELQYNILTNLFELKTDDTLYWIRQGLGTRREMFYSAYCFQPTTNDIAYLNLCADYLGQKMNPVEYEHELRNGGYAWYNEQIVWSKELMLKRFANLVARYEELLSAESRPAFRTNVIERARLTEAEQRILWPLE